MASALDVAASAKVGTLGIGADVAMPLGDQFNARAVVNFLPAFDITSLADPGEEADDVITDLSVELSGMTAGAFADWHPTAGSFRMTVGVLFNSNEAEITVTPNAITVDGRRYTLSEADGDVTFASTCPYVGIGMGNPFKGEGNWSFTMDLGVMFHGTPEVDLRATASVPSTQGIVDAEVAKQEQDVQDQVDAISVWPVVSVGAAYKF